VTHILPDSGSYTVDCILEKARQLVRRRGVRILVVDPLNRIDQQLEPGQTELQYITSLLNKLSRFALQHSASSSSWPASAQGEPQHHQRRTAAGGDE